MLPASVLPAAQDMLQNFGKNFLKTDCVRINYPAVFSMLMMRK